jgi:hypothetical protein
MRVWAIGTGCAESNLGSYMVMGDRSSVPLSDNPIFSKFEDPGYRAFFEACEKVLFDHEANVLSDAAAVAALDDILRGYDFTMPLRDDVHGHEWAITTSGCRDIFLGKPELHERWLRSEVDSTVTV